MTGNPENTGQISVAELLARNGQEVASRGGRRRRGNAGGISVAELTGEIPVVDSSPTRNRRAAPDVETDGSVGVVAASVLASTTAWPAPVEPAEAPEPPKPVEPAKPVETATPAAQPAPESVPEPVVEHTQAIPALRRAVLAKADADRKAASDRASQKNTPVAKAAPAAAPVAPKPAPLPDPVAEKKPVVAPKPTPAPKPPVAPKDAVPSAVEENAAEQTAIVAKGTAGTAPQSNARSIEEPPATAPSPVPTATEPEPTKAQSASKVQPVSKAQPVSKDQPAAKPGPKAKQPGFREPALLAGSSLEADLLRQARDARSESLEEARAKVHTTGEFPRVVAAPSQTDDDESSEEQTPEPASNASAVRQWAVLAGQAAVAIVTGALLFKGFEKLWDSLPWVALALAVLVIAGLVAVVRILRQTEDLLSLLIAVIVGVLVTIGPLVFVLSSS